MLCQPFLYLTEQNLDHQVQCCQLCFKIWILKMSLISLYFHRKSLWNSCSLIHWNCQCLAFTEKSTQTNRKIVWNHHSLIFVWHFSLGRQFRPYFWVYRWTLFELNGHALYWIWARKWHRSSYFKQKSTSHFGGNLYAYFWSDATYCLACILPRTRIRLSGKIPKY